MKEVEHERRDWIIVAIILLIGLLTVFIAGQWAVRFPPNWELNTDMESRLNLKLSYPQESSTSLVKGFGQELLTQPVWYGSYLTPDAIIPTRIPSMNTSTPTSNPTRVPPTNTSAPAETATSTLVYIPPTSTSNPASTKTSTPTSTSTVAASTSTPTRTFTPTPTLTRTPTPTNTPTFTPTSVSTSTSTPTFTPTSASTSTSTPTPTNTPTLTPTNTLTNTPTFTPTSTPTNTPPPVADLGITIDDGIMSVGVGETITYTINVSNAGPASVTGALVTSTFSGNLQNISCSKSTGTPCTLNGMGNLNDTVDLAAGSSITYTVRGTVSPTTNTDVSSTVTVTVPMGITDPGPNPNTATDTDTLLVGTTPDGNVYNVMAGTYLTLNLTVSAGPGWDLVYYERPAGSGVLLDLMIVEVWDGTTWIPVFNWGDNFADANTNVDFTTLPGFPQTPEEYDQRDIPAANLYPFPGTGIAIDLDSLGLTGTYTAIRFYAPTAAEGDIDGHTEVDAIQVLH